MSWPAPPAALRHSPGQAEGDANGFTAAPSIGRGVRAVSAGTDDVPVGEATAIQVMGLDLALYNVDGAFYCTDNVCSHAYALLSEGWLEGHLIDCPLHNGQFDVRTGEGQGAPITVAAEFQRDTPIRT